jgi:hypothetical protein
MPIFLNGPFSLTYAGGYAKNFGRLVTLLLVTLQILKQKTITATLTYAGGYAKLFFK